MANFWNRKASSLLPEHIFTTNAQHYITTLNIDAGIGDITKFNYVILETIYGRRESHISVVQGTSWGFQLTTTHTYTDQWIGDIEGTINLANKTIQITQISAANIRTGTVYKLTDGPASGIVYPYISNVYLL